MSTPGQRAGQEGGAKNHSRTPSGQLIPPLPPSNRKASLDASQTPSPGPHLIAPDAKESSVANMEEARVIFDVIARAVEDAVYLDENAYKEIAPTMQFTKVIRAQQRKIEHLEDQLQQAKSKLEESNSVRTEALQRHAEMQQEIENNAVVFQMHYQELLRKDDEIKKLTAVIQALSGK